MFDGGADHDLFMRHATKSTWSNSLVGSTIYVALLRSAMGPRFLYAILFEVVFILPLGFATYFPKSCHERHC